MTRQMHLTRAPHPAWLPHLDHPAVPHAHALSTAPRRQHERAVLVPVEGEHLAPRDGDRERRGGQRGRERVRRGRVARRAQVEELHRAVRGARGEHGGAGAARTALGRRMRGALAASTRPRALRGPQFDVPVP